MSKTHPRILGPHIRISIVAHLQLVRECLSSLMQNNPDLQVLTLCGLKSSLLKLEGSDITVVYLEEHDPVEIIGEILDANPEIKVVAITDGEDLDSSTRALKLGAVGIVRSDQSSKLLIEAIRKAFKGETWLNQALLSNLLKNGDQIGVKRSAGTAGQALETITRREKEVIAMIGNGLKSKVIAERLFISEATVRHHLSSIYGKLGVDDRLNLVIYAFRHGLISITDESIED